VRLGQREARAVGANHEIRAQRQGGAPAAGVGMHQADDRLAHIGHVGTKSGRVEAPELLQIGAGAKAAAFGADHQRVRRAVVVERAHQRAELGHHMRGQRIHPAVGRQMAAAEGHAAGFGFLISQGGGHGGQSSEGSRHAHPTATPAGQAARDARIRSGRQAPDRTVPEMRSMYSVALAPVSAHDPAPSRCAPRTFGMKTE
jgi:hypothetical protein